MRFSGLITIRVFLDPTVDLLFGLTKQGKTQFLYNVLHYL